MKEKLRALGRRWPWLGRALDVQDRFSEINGRSATSAITISVFIAIFPLLLVAIAIIGYLASGDQEIPSRVIDNLGLTGSTAETMRDAIATASDSKRTASVVGLAGLAWSGSGVAVALQQGVRTPWQQRSKGIKDRLLGITFLVLGGIGFAAAIALGGVLNFLPDEVPKAVVAVAAIAVGVAAEIGLFWWMFVSLGTRRVTPRDLLPGAIAAGIGFEILKLVGTVYVPQLVAKSSSLYGPLGIVFAILAWLAIFARLIVYCSTLNAVRFEAREGTMELTLYAPRFADVEPIGATRGGVVLTADGKFEPSIPDPEAGSPAEEIAEARDHDHTVDALRAESEKVRAETKIT